MCASLPPSHCINHEDSMVELQAISFSQKHQSHRYVCVYPSHLQTSSDENCVFKMFSYVLL